MSRTEHRAEIIPAARVPMARALFCGVRWAVPLWIQGRLLLLLIADVR